MSREIVKVSPAAIQWRYSVDFGRDPIDHEQMKASERHPVATTDKYRSIVQRYVEGRPWELTPLFNIYRERLTYESVRGCTTIGELLAQYRTRVDAMYADMRAHGYRRYVNGHEAPPVLTYLAHDGALVMGNQGNHRIAMAQILCLQHVLVEIVARHPESGRADLIPEPSEDPDLPTCAQAIPAMTSDAERRCYYRLAREAAPAGAVVELGAWLGASTAYIAAAMRDAQVATRAQVYDRFIWKASAHNKKAGGPIPTTQLEAFRQNLGPLMAYVDVHQRELVGSTWNGGPVALLVCDAPKRIKEISAVLTTFAAALQPGAIMAWQDFGYFPSYDIPAALMRLGDRVELVEAVHPGTTAVFRVRRSWKTVDVSPSALALTSWTPDEVEASWDRWTEQLPEPMRPRFACGAAMFLCDLGAHDRARARLRQIVNRHPEDVLPKWRYLLEERGSLMRRYEPLIDLVTACA